MTEATEKQIKFATNLGIPEAGTYSKEALRELIDRALTTRDAKKPGKVAQNAPKAEKEYHLTEEAIRIGALNAATQMGRPEDFWVMVGEFENYIRNGRSD